MSNRIFHHPYGLSKSVKAMKIAAVLFIAIIASGGLYLVWSKNSASSSLSNIPASPDAEWGNPESAKMEAEKEAVRMLQAGEMYTDAELGLAFRYPKGFGVARIPPDGSDDDAGSVLIQNPEKNVGFQISALAYDGPVESLTKDAIESRLGAVSNYSVIAIGRNQGVQAVTFLSGDKVLYREVWFVQNGMLYQGKAFQSSEPLVIAVLKTLEIQPIN